MKILRHACFAILALIMTMTTGCQTVDEIAQGKSIQPIAGSSRIQIPGPSSIRPDGSVKDIKLNRPNGRLLQISGHQQLRAHQVQPWARNQVMTVANASGLSADEVQGWIQIKGPRTITVEEVVKVPVYDVRLEVWKLAQPPRKRERAVE
ncbi:MAG: hypothetical protein CMJ39_02865 [Phycisphaerae bacterium]|nr:hypothetical protein [Phycisphaerae bacterium]|tara:strand:- start:1955 stop:2404 length:450 start_codon:yes stop_codon:yes gene_type:complete